jgi:hypothetical protein
MSDRQVPWPYLFCATWDEYATAMLDLLPHRGLAPLFKRWAKHSPESTALYETDPNAAIATFLTVLRASAGPHGVPLPAYFTATSASDTRRSD